MLNLLEEILRPQRLRDLTPERLSYFQSELRKVDDDGKARSENTIASYLKMLQAVLGWAVEMGMLAEIPKIKKPKRATASGKGRAKSMKGRPITTEEFERMLLKLPKALFEPVRPKRRKSKPSKSKGKKTANRKSPWKPLPEAQRPPVIDSWQRLMRGLWLSGLRLGEALDLYWGREARVVVNTDAQGRVNFASAHDLRRSFGDRWSRRVMPQVLQELMRHSDIKTTMRYYVDRNAEATADAAWAAFAALGDNLGDTDSAAGQSAPKRKAATRYQEAASISRGDWRLTFPNDTTGVGLMHVALAQTVSFTADTFHSLGSASA